MKILVINPGGMSTKVAVYDGCSLLFNETIEHSKSELGQFSSILSQKEHRKELIVRILEKHSLSVNEIDQFVGRGGMVRNLAGGVIA